MHGIALFIGYCVIGIIAIRVAIAIIGLFVLNARAFLTLKIVVWLCVAGAFLWFDITYLSGALMGWIVIFWVIAGAWTIGRAFWYRKTGDPSDIRVRRKKLGYDD